VGCIHAWGVRGPLLCDLSSSLASLLLYYTTVVCTHTGCIDRHARINSVLSDSDSDSHLDDRSRQIRLYQAVRSATGKPSGAVKIAGGEHMKPPALYRKKYAMTQDVTVVRYIKWIFDIRYNVRVGAAVQRTPTSHRSVWEVSARPPHGVCSDERERKKRLPEESRRTYQERKNEERKKR
jgi:hypothetical protein